MSGNYDTFPVNIAETAGEIERKAFIFDYYRYEVWQGGACIYSNYSKSKIITQIINNNLKVIINDESISEFINNEFYFKEISTNNDRVMWSKDIFNLYDDIEYNTPDVSSLFYKNGILSKVTFTIHNPNTLVEFYADENNMTFSESGITSETENAFDKQEAKRILYDSIANLHSRRGKLTQEDIEAEVINNACLAYLKKEKELTNKADIIENLVRGLLNSKLNIMPIAKAFTDAALELLPRYYTVRESAIALLGIQQNVQWEGIWDFLKDYFEANHGIRIDEAETNTYMYYSNHHQRFENDIMVSESQIQRTININFIEENEIVVGIAPTLSPKKAYLIYKEEKIKKYKGYDPDYLFIITFDEFYEISKFILEIPNRNLRIEYFE